MNLQKNDLIELDYEKNCIKLAKIIHVSENEVACIDLNNGKKIFIQTKELYLKEEITGQRLCPQHENQIKMLGGQNLWVRLTQSQYNKINKNQKEISQSIKEIDDRQIEKLKKWFLENKDEEKKEDCIQIFNNTNEKEIDESSINIFGENKSSPLSRFIKKSI